MGSLTRRGFLGAAGAAVAGAGVAGAAWQGLATGVEGHRNVVLIVIDSVRADHLGCYGNGTMRTPNVDALARESMRFERVFPEAMPTVPARRSILTGRRSFPFRDWQPWSGMAKRPGWEPIPAGTPTIVDDFRAAGYWTGFVGDNPFLCHTGVFQPFRDSLDRFMLVPGQRGELYSVNDVSEEEALRWLPEPLRADQYVFSMRRYLANNGRGRDESETAAARVFTEATRQLAQVPRRPFFLMVDCFDPHEPWCPTPKYMEMYGDPAYDGPEIGTLRYARSDYLDDAQIERVRATYKASLTLVDAWLGRFLERLLDSRLADDTVVALVSDHGIHLGDHQWLGKGDFRLHPSLIHVPLLIRDPEGRGAESTSDWFATTVDLAPTLMSLAGLDPSPRHEGADLAPILDGRDPDEQREFAYGGYSNYCFLDDGKWKLIARNDNSVNMLFDLEHDPEELDDVSAAHPEVVERLFRRIVAQTGGEPPTYTREDFQAQPREL